MSVRMLVGHWSRQHPCVDADQLVVMLLAGLVTNAISLPYHTPQPVTLDNCIGASLCRKDMTYQLNHDSAHASSSP